MTDVIFGAAHNYGWEQFRPYAISLSRTGFSGTKIMFVQNITDEARKNLISLGFQLVDTNFPDKVRHKHEYGKKRFICAVDYLKNHLNDFRYVIWTDVRDLVFQSDPSIWLDTHTQVPCILAANMSGWAIKHGPQEDEAASRLGPEIYPWLREQPSYCSGSIAGDFNNMLYLMDMIASNPDYELWDESYFNYLVRVSPLKEVVRVPKPEEGFAATVDWIINRCWGDDVLAWRRTVCTEKFPIFDEGSGLVIAPESGIPYCILHQYDRDAKWKEIIHNKYRE